MPFRLLVPASKLYLPISPASDVSKIPSARRLLLSYRHLQFSALQPWTTNPKLWINVVLCLIPPVLGVLGNTGENHAVTWTDANKNVWPHWNSRPVGGAVNWYYHLENHLVVSMEAKCVHTLWFGNSVPKYHLFVHQKTNGLLLCRISFLTWPPTTNQRSSWKYIICWFSDKSVKCYINWTCQMYFKISSSISIKVPHVKGSLYNECGSNKT